ncbi:MAG: hypothetical protein ACRDP8_03260 [Actinopolymorphaceae bacterium]
MGKAFQYLPEVVRTDAKVLVEELAGVVILPLHEGKGDDTKRECVQLSRLDEVLGASKPNVR